MCDVKSKHVAIIGAGVSGLVTTKELLELGHTVVTLERSSCIGGVYATHYDSLTMTSSSATTRFGSRSRVDDAHPAFWTKDGYLAYLEDYAQRYHLFKHIHIGRKVVNVTRTASGRWLVRWHQDGEPDNEESEEFDAVAVCCGVHARPRWPEIPGLKEFPGVIQHSSTFTGHEDLSKDTVLVIGLGESGSDIALMAAKKARQTLLSTRKGPGYVVPRMACGLPSDVDTTRAYYSFPTIRYNHLALRIKRMLDSLYRSPNDDTAVASYIDSVNARRGLPAHQRFGTKNASYVESVLYHDAVEKPATVRFEGHIAHFADGTSAPVDRIVLCTGYLPDSAQQLLPDCPEIGADFEPRGLYKRMFVPTIGKDLAFIGLVRPGMGSIPPMVEMQARYLALITSGLKTLPSQKTMCADIAERRRRDHVRYVDDAVTTRSLTDFLSYMDNMAEVIGCKPSLLRLLLTDPRTWYKVLFGPINGVQYRLCGPGADPQRARASLHAMRTVGRWVVAYEAAVLLLCAPFRLMMGLLLSVS